MGKGPLFALRAALYASVLAASAGCGGNVIVDGAPSGEGGAHGAGSSGASVVAPPCTQQTLLHVASSATVDVLATPDPFDVCITFQGSVLSAQLVVTTTPIDAPESPFTLILVKDDGTVLEMGTDMGTPTMRYTLLRWTPAAGIEHVKVRVTAGSPLATELTMTMPVPR